MAARGREVDSVYYIPNMRAWFVESTMYPFIGGDTVGGARASVPGLTPAVQWILGAIVLLVNLIAYLYLWHCRSSR
jgi:hypothetical protein